MYRALAGACISVLVACPAWSAPISLDFTATVTSSLVHPPGETWGDRNLPVGAKITGRISYNALSTVYVLDRFFEMQIGPHTVNYGGFGTEIQRFGEPNNYVGGDRVLFWSQGDFEVRNGRVITYEFYNLAFVALNRTILTDEPLLDVLSWEKFDLVELRYSLQSLYGYVQLVARVDEIVDRTKVNEPIPLSLMAFGAVTLMALRKRKHRPRPTAQG